MGFDRWRTVLPLRLRSLFQRDTVERELDDELQYHLERQVDLNLERGMAPAEARRAARRALGSLALHKDGCRDQRRVSIVENAIRDVRYGLRLLRRSPIFAGVAILSLALGIGANAAIFQLIDTVRLRSLAIPNPQELAEVRPDGPQAFGNYDGINSKATYPLWELIARHQDAFSGLFAWGDAALVVGRGVEARPARGLWVSGDFFTVLGIAPERGRLLGPDDDRRGCGGQAAVVSHAFWRTHFGGRDAAIGSTLTLADRPFTVVGVTPPSFSGLEIGETFDVALPTCAAALWDARLERRDRWWLTIMGRLKPGWTVGGANQQLQALSQSFLDATVPPGYDAGFIEGYRRIRFSVVPAGRGVSRLRDEHGTSLSLLLGLTLLVLLITCGNLATLMLARASARGREIAVRMAIGASRPRLVSQMLIESLMIATAGALLAVPVALFASRTLVAFLATTAQPVTINLTPDWRLMAFVGATAIATTILFGLLPAIRVSVVDPLVVMRQGSRGMTVDRQRARFQRGLVIAQVAVSLVLIFSALLFVQTFRNLTKVEIGFDADRTIAVLLSDRSSEGLSDDQKIAFQEQLTGEIRSVPGVAGAASSTHIPLSGSTWSHFFRAPDGGNKRRASRFAYVSPGYFGTLGIPVRSGRDFTGRDRARSGRVMVVNDSFVRSHLSGRSPIGETIRTLPEPGFPEATYEIIGVVGDTKYADLREENCWCAANQPGAPIAYVPIAQNPSPYAWAPVMVRVGTASPEMAGAIGRRIERLNPDIRVHFVDLRTRVREKLAGERMIAWLAGAFGILAMAIVAVGLYGIIAYLAVSRRHEIGIRLSLGSTRSQIATLVMRDNLWLMAAGLATGVPLAVAAMRSAGTLLFGLAATDIPTLAGATCLLAGAGLLAGAIPAWRAAHTRPDVALRDD
jgi:predicted permease